MNASRPLTGRGLLIDALLFVLALLVAIFAASTPRPAANAIPADDRKESVPTAPASSGNLAAASEASPVDSRAPASTAAHVGQASTAASHSPPTTRPSPFPAIIGTATWCAPTATQCLRWGGHALLGAVPTFRFGDEPYRVLVRHGSRFVIVTVVSFCACPRDRIIDLSPWAFGRLAPLSRGVIAVEVARLR